LLPLAGRLERLRRRADGLCLPSMTADAKNAYLSGGPYVYAVNLQTGAQVWRFPALSSAANPFYATPVLTPDGQLMCRRVRQETLQP